MRETFGRRDCQTLVALTAGAALLRFSTLATQSYWYDEAITAHLVQRSFHEVLSEIPNSESTPPLYYLLAFAWSRLFGVDEAGLRSLSAVLGTATVPAAYAAARGFVSPRSSLITAAFVAVSPFLIWYSQEARAYALLVLFATLSLVFVRRAADRISQKWLASWVVTCSLAILTHYFAIFLVAAESAWLLLRDGRRRAVRLAVAIVAMAAVVVAPLALYQAENSTHTAWIANAGDLHRRVAYLLHQLVIGVYPASHIRPLIAVVPIVILVGLFAWTDQPERNGALLAVTFGLAAIGPALGLALIADFLFEGRGDYFIFRNMIAATVPFTIAAATVFGTQRAGAAGKVAAVVICTLLVAISIDISRRPDLQRPNVRRLTTALGHAGAARATVVDVRTGVVMKLYRPELKDLSNQGAWIRELNVVQEESNSPPPSVPPGFVQREIREVDASSQRFRILRWEAPRRRFASAESLRAALRGTVDVAILLDSPKAERGRED